MADKMCVNGKIIEMTENEITENEKRRAITQTTENTRPLTTDEIARLIIRQQVNTLPIDNAIASRMVDYYPTLTGDGSLVKAETKINWHGMLKEAAVDLWDTDTNTPDSAPTLWSDIAYRDGIRIIPETITAVQAFAIGEFGWWDGHIYRSTIASNVYTPNQYAAAWEKIS